MTKDNLETEGTVIKYSKAKGRGIIILYVFLMGLAMFIFSSQHIIYVFVNNKLDFDIIDSYIVLMYSAFLLLLSNGFLLSYFGNKITMFNSYIIIRRAGLGKLYIISKSCIQAKNMVFMSAQGIYNYQIQLYLKNGKKISTGFLNCKRKEFDKIYEKFEFNKLVNINPKALKKSQFHVNSNKAQGNEYTIKTNCFFPLLTTYLPLIVLIVGISFLSSGFNYKYGVQNHFKLNGIITEKKAEKNKDNINYKIVVLECSSTDKYDINVTKDIYNQYDVNGKIIITGTKGSLGIPYGISFLKAD